jgi:hypothetical protein
MQVRTFTLVLVAALLSVGAVRGQDEPAATDVDDAYDESAPAPDPTIDVGFFYRELSPYGEWIRRPDYGWVWFPRHMAPSWRPYSYGHWALTDYGWTWVSDEDFGWATYHYGRWTYDPDIGWVWIPGAVWSPAWVAWRHGNGYVGWAPLPPAVGFDLGVGLRLGGFDLNVAIEPSWFAFVDERRLVEPRVVEYIVPPARNITIVQNTVNITNYTVVDRRVVNNGVPVARIEEVIGRPVQRLQVTSASTRGRASVRGTTLAVYRPPQTALGTVKVAQRNDAGVTASHAILPNVRPVTTKPAAATVAVSKTSSSNPTVLHPLATHVPVSSVAQHTPAPSFSSLERSHRAETKALESHQSEDRSRLQQMHRQDLALQHHAPAGNLAAQQAAELKVQQEQHAQEQRQLQTRQQIEHQAVQVRPPAKPPKSTPPPKNGQKPPGA